MPSSPGHAGRRPRSQSERSQTTQRKIIESAMRLLEEVGFQQTSLQEIARGADVTLGAVQHQFGSRQTLMEKVVDEVLAPLSAVGQAWPTDALSLPLEARAREFVQRVWHEVYGRPSYVGAWSLFFGCKTTPELFQRIDDQRAEYDPKYFAHFVSVFPEIASHQAEPEHFAAVVFATLRGLAVMRLFQVDETATRLQLDVVARMIVQAGSAAGATR